MDLEEALAQADVYSNGETEEYCTLESDTSRVVVIPDRYKTFGVEGDNRAERIKFKFPKVVGDNIDLSSLNLRINYQNAQGGLDKYIVETVLETDDDHVFFTWLIQDGVTPKSGPIYFVVQAVKVTSNGNIEKKWSTTLNKIGQVLEGLEVDEMIEQQNPDIIEALLQRMDDVEDISTPEAMQEYVNQYLTENPVSGMTAEQEQQLNKNTEDISSLSEELDDLQESTNNIFDEKYVRDYYINPTNGIVGVNSENWGYSENFIPLSSEISSVTFSSPNVKETINIIIICYDSNKQYLSSFGVRSIDSIDNYFTVSFKQNSNKKYIRFNIQNVNDIVESNCNLMVEYGTVPTDYYPNKRIKNSTKIEVLEDKIDEIFKEFVIFGETYLEYGKKMTFLSFLEKQHILLKYFTFQMVICCIM